MTRSKNQRARGNGGEPTAVELTTGQVKVFSSRGTLSRYLQRRKASLDKTGAIRQDRKVIGYIITTARSFASAELPQAAA